MFKLSLTTICVALLSVFVMPVGAVQAAEPLSDLTAIEYRTPDEEFVQIVMDQRLSAQADIIEHVVSRGETLSAIAKIYDVSVASICQNNNITNPDRIWPDQKLVFPSSDGLLYTVAESSSVWDLAEAFGVEPARLIMVNGLVNYELDEDQVVVIPGHVKPLPRPVSSSPARSSVVSQASRELPSIIWPLEGHLVSFFGAPRPGRRHTGLDIAVAKGTEIKAVAPGTVVLSRFYGGLGYTVILEHSPGFRTLYGHADKLLVRVGDVVNTGDIIALSGNTGNSSGPHLHFEILYRGSPIDPLPILRR